jgi:hypothetical protein
MVDVIGPAGWAQRLSSRGRRARGGPHRTHRRAEREDPDSNPYYAEYPDEVDRFIAMVEEEGQRHDQTLEREHQLLG